MIRRFSFSFSLFPSIFILRVALSVASVGRKGRRICSTAGVLTVATEEAVYSLLLVLLLALPTFIMELSAFLFLFRFEPALAFRWANSFSARQRSGPTCM